MVGELAMKCMGVGEVKGEEERWALRVDMRATCKLSSAPGVQMSTSGAVRRGIVARMAEFIEASIVR